MENKTHKIIAAAFKEDFSLSELTGDWKSSSFTFDAKECKIKRVSGGLMYAYSFGAVTFIDVGQAEQHLRHFIEKRPRIYHHKAIVFE